MWRYFEVWSLETGASIGWFEVDWGTRMVFRSASGSSAESGGFEDAWLVFGSALAAATPGSGLLPLLFVHQTSRPEPVASVFVGGDFVFVAPIARSGGGGVCKFDSLEAAKAAVGELLSALRP